MNTNQTAVIVTIPGTHTRRWQREADIKDATEVRLRELNMDDELKYVGYIDDVCAPREMSSYNVEVGIVEEK